MGLFEFISDMMSFSEVEAEAQQEEQVSRSTKPTERRQAFILI
jgi:hypothetical protein